MSALFRRQSGQWLELKLDVDFNGGAPVHGRSITAVNTGHTAYFDAGLGRNVTDGDMIVHAGLVSASDFVSNGGTMSKHYFQGGLIIDRDNITFTACRIDGGFDGFSSGTHRPFSLQWCTIDTSGAAGPNGIQYQDYTAHRCRINGNSDGAKTNGNVTITESYIRCEGEDVDDHNDGVQNVGGNGNVTIERCNIDCRPLNNVGAPNAALFAADNCTGLMTWNDNLVAGGGYVMRCYENATYNVQGNEILDNSWVFGPVARAVIPASNLTWGTLRLNYIVSDNGTQLSVLEKP